MKKILATLLIVLVLVGCSSKKTVIAACTQTDGVYTVNVTLESTNGKTITTFVQDSSLDLKVAGIDEEQFKTLANDLSPSFDGKGMTYTFDVKDGLGIEKFVVDMKEVEVEMLQNAGIIDAATNTTVLDFEKTLENYEGLGLTCTKSEK